MLNDLKAIYVALLPHKAILDELSIAESANGSTVLRVNDVYLSDTPTKTIRSEGSSVIIHWDEVELNICYEDVSSSVVEYSAINIYANDTFIGEILL
jgi:hypothetical protein|nr:MAG TPA: hypothetical protein [Caudoviricetes sp.]